MPDARADGVPFGQPGGLGRLQARELLPEGFMRMLLRSNFPNGPFGDPALYVWEINGKRALLFDCGDLSRFSTRQLLKVTHIFLSHCHIDHFFGFDLYLRLHVGSEKSTTIFGPPETSKRVAGKLQGYTWNLVSDQSFEFIAVDLDPVRGVKESTRFHARDRFLPSNTSFEEWCPGEPILDTGFYNVKAAMLDHRTPSMAYAIEEKLTAGVNAAAIHELGLKPGSWINTLKQLFLFGGLDASRLQAATEGGGVQSFQARELANRILLPRQRHKIVYATDAAAHGANRRALLELAWGADLFFCETCFLQEDEELAAATKHFTAEFIGELAREADVKKLAPFHFSKRYIECPERVLDEAGHHFKGEVIRLSPAASAHD